MLEPQKTVAREAPQPEPARKALVTQLCNEVAEWEKHWEYAFNRMRRDRRFARGKQWPEHVWNVPDAERPYVANITLRHLKQRTAAIYARNPKIVYRRRDKLWYRLWDGNPDTLVSARQRLMGAPDPMTGMPPPPPTPEDVAIVQEYEQVAAQKDIVDRIGQTAQLLTDYYIGEQNRPHKLQMKRMVLRAHTVGVAYIVPDYQRLTGMQPEDEQALKDVRAQLARAERLSADLADEETQPDDAEAERLRSIMGSLQSKPEVLLREGLAFRYPDPTCIIPDTNCISLLTFEGSSRVAEKYLLTPERVQEVYNIDVSEAYTSHKDKRLTESKHRTEKTEYAAVYEVWDKDDNLVYTICDGYPDFLVEPREPDVFIERFWPWFAYVPNWNDDDEDPFPPSDVELIMAQQMEINRAGEGLRDHRYAARPRMVSTVPIEDEDRAKHESPDAHTILELKAAQGRKIEEVLARYPTNPIDPNLYLTDPAMQDVLRVVGSQEANLGGMSNGTATEVAIAENSRQSALTSSRDELDDLLTHLARAAGQILLLEMERGTVNEIVGPGAVWPQQDREDVAKEVLLEVEAGSTGRPNQAEQVQTRERLLPYLLQVPGLSPRKLAADMVRVMDDSIDPDDWWEQGTPSITAMNGMMQASASGQQGADQGPQGSNNAPRPQEREGTPGMPRGSASDR